MKEEVSQHRRNSQQPTRPVTSVETPKTPLCPRTSWGRGRPPRSRQLLSGQVITVASLRGEKHGPRGGGAVQTHLSRRSLSARVWSSRLLAGAGIQSAPAEGIPACVHGGAISGGHLDLKPCSVSTPHSTLTP